MITSVEVIKKITDRISMSCCFGAFTLRVERDNKVKTEYVGDGRIFLQVIYIAPCSKIGVVQGWRGRKFYLSDHMTVDELIKTAYLAFKLAVEHEVMEGFKVDGKILFNPHVDFESLLKISDQEVKRHNHGD